MGVDGFGSGGGTEQLGDLGETFGLGLGGEGEILAVGLAFACECGLEIVLGGHGGLLFPLKRDNLSLFLRFINGRVDWQNGKL